MISHNQTHIAVTEHKISWPVAGASFVTPGIYVVVSSKYNFLTSATIPIINLEDRVTIVSDNLSLLSNYTSALLEFWIWSDAKTMWCYHWWLLVKCNAALGLESSIVKEKTSNFEILWNPNWRCIHLWLN